MWLNFSIFPIDLHKNDHKNDNVNAKTTGHAEGRRRVRLGLPNPTPILQWGTFLRFTAVNAPESAKHLLHLVSACRPSSGKMLDQISQLLETPEVMLVDILLSMM